MKINKDELQKALEIVKPGLANKELVEQSTYFAFMGDRIVTFNDLLSVSHPIENMELEGAVRAEELYEFLQKLKAKEIQIKVTENELQLKSGKSRAGVALINEIKLALHEIEHEKDWYDMPEEFLGDLDFVKDSCSKDMSRKILTCAHVADNMLEASDGFQIMRVYTDPEITFPFECLIPSEYIPEILKINPSMVAQSSGWLHFKNMNGTELSCRIINDEYPSTSSHFDIEGEKIVFPDEMDEILERARVFTKGDYKLDEEMEILLKSGKLLVHGKNNYGWFKEPVKVKYSGEPVSFWISPYLLQNILKRSSECTLGKDKIHFAGEGWEYIATLRG